MKVHCEINGEESSLAKTRILTKIDGIISLKACKNPIICQDSQTISTVGKPPYKYFIKIEVPNNLLPILGDLYATVNDEDDVEQSTNILSDEGLKNFMGRQLLELIPYIDQYEVIDFSAGSFFISVNSLNNFKPQIKICDNCGDYYKGMGKKFMVKKIIETKKEQGFGGILWPGFDIAISDCSEYNPKGVSYLFKTDKNFESKSFCSNECAVEYCIENNSIVYYNDFINEGKLRVLTEYTPELNNNLKNDYRYRSSNI